MKSMYSVSEIARYFRISNQTLHYYDRIGLFKPSYVDPQTKYRYYNQEHFNQMFMIQELKSVGFSLEEIAKVQKNQNLQSLGAILKKNRQDLMGKIEELNALQAHMDFYLDMIALSKRPHKKNQCQIQQIPARYAFYINASFTLQDLSQYVEVIYKAYVKAARLSKPAVISNKMVLTMDQNAINQGKFRYYSGIGLLLTSPIRHPNSYTIEPCLCATAIHVGQYSTLPTTYKKLCTFIQEQGYMVAGHATEASLSNIVQTKNPHEFVTEIQIPICKISYSQNATPAANGE